MKKAKALLTLTGQDYQNNKKGWMMWIGDKIEILHAKDFVAQAGTKKVVSAGKGMLNYDLVIKLLKSRNRLIVYYWRVLKSPSWMQAGSL